MTRPAGMDSGRLVQADLLRSGVDVLLDAEVMDVEKPDDTGAVRACVCVCAREAWRDGGSCAVWGRWLQPLPCALLACAHACLPGALARGHSARWDCLGVALRHGVETQGCRRTTLRELWVPETVRAMWCVEV